TAGHINPAIFIAKKILEKEPDSQILFVGTPNGMENRLVTKEGFEIDHVEVMGFQRKLSAKNVKAAYLAFASVGKAKKILQRFRPDVVIGTGGYVSWPVLRAAASKKIPTLIHEQNAFPGLTTRKLSKVVDRVCLSFEASRSYFDGQSEKLVLTGNPTAPELNTLSAAKARSELGISAPFILSYGGSLGASAINEAVFALAKNYSCKKPIFHTHAFGVREYEKWMNLEKTEGICRFGNVKFCDYIYDMPKQMMASDLVISRSGAITLAELSLLGKPAILIPSPNVTDNHQYKNALVYAENGAAVLIEEKDLTPEKLIKEIDRLIRTPQLLAQMSANMKKLAHPGATDRILDEICKIRK
ncbi:MAG: undecaprenyldiphospho-muramoylpentapeptide beta-N-acetylglucosaminyltransferase, partial [Clostridia bacterium]|nr:undecaprenyldiphospho-muramoylpentapeptide beta-N-acetylglucosaminyltransferase [Clostridia bacterium]